MKIYDEQIVKYLDGQFSAEEKIEFEKQLRYNEDLKKAFDEYQNVNELISFAKTGEVNENYFDNIIPRFRQLLNKKIRVSPVKKLSYAFVTVILFVGSFYIFDNYRVNNSSDNNTIESITQNISGEQINEMRDYLTDNSWVVPNEDLVYQAVDEDDFNLDGIMQKISTEEKLNILTDYQINNLESFAGEDELQQTYDELLTKSIL